MSVTSRSIDEQTAVIAMISLKMYMQLEWITILINVPWSSLKFVKFTKHVFCISLTRCKNEVSAITNKVYAFDWEKMLFIHFLTVSLLITIIINMFLLMTNNAK